MALGNAGAGGPAWLLVSAGLGSGQPMLIPSPLRPHPLCCLFMLHTPMAITSSSSLGKWERPAAGPAREHLSLSLSFSLSFSLSSSISSCFSRREPFPSPLTPHSCSSHPMTPSVDGVLPLKIPCFCVPVSCSPVSSVPVLPCDGNVLVNCITNLLCVYVCLWGWFIIFCWSLDPFV